MSYAEEIHRLAAEERQEEHDHAAAFMEGFRTFAENVRNREPEPEALQDPRCTAELAEAFNVAAIENLFTWNDGAENWTLDNLADAITDEALDGMGEDSEITLTADGLTEDAKLDFVEGFTDAAPSGYDPEADAETDCPWLTPWHWADKADWFKPELTPYQMGAEWAEWCRAEMEAEL